MQKSYEGVETSQAYIKPINQSIIDSKPLDKTKNNL